jgi:hypothetical protein
VAASSSVIPATISLGSLGIGEGLRMLLIKGVIKSEGGG